MKPGLGDLGDALLALATTALGLAVAIWLLDGVSLGSTLGVVLMALMVAAGDLVARPPLRVLARVAGAMGALVTGLAAQLLVLWFALELVPGVRLEGPRAAVWVLVVAGVVMAGGRWVLGVNDSAYVLGDVLRRARSHARRTSAGTGTPGVVRPPGLLLVQLDGVGRQVLEHAVEAGLAPVLARWIRGGTHRITPWWVQPPATTPATQAGLLYGDLSQVPAFRWWDRELDRLVVANHPGDAAMIESRLEAAAKAGAHDGRPGAPGNAGLLSPDGVAVSMMFTGGARTNLLVMSRSGIGTKLGPGQAFLRFFASPFVLTRSLTLTLAEVFKELYQGHRQRMRGVVPRLERGGWYVLLRAVSNVLLRDLNTALVAEHLLAGAPTIVVDLVDYDEIAHHAGPLRPESLRALEGLDRVLGILEQVAAGAPRDYRIVVVSDHGQSLGATFEQAHGTSLRGLVVELTGVSSPASEAAGGEDWGPLMALAAAAFPSLSERLAHRRLRGTDPDAPAPPRSPEVAVTASGNLGMVWFPREKERMTLEQLQDRWPRLVPGLAAHPGIGVVVARSVDRGTIALGPRGLRVLDGGAVEGEDPLVAYGDRADVDLARLAAMATAGDLIVISRVSRFGHVHAFERQIGSHGGLGGQQNHAFLVHPTADDVDPSLLTCVDGVAMLDGSVAVHDQLLTWMRTWSER